MNSQTPSGEISFNPLRLLAIVAAPFIGVGIGIAAILFPLVLAKRAGFSVPLPNLSLSFMGMSVFAGIIAVVFLLCLLFIAAAMLRSLNLQDHPYALGLPKHSVRAVIALSFLILLGAMCVFTVRTALTEFKTVTTMSAPIDTLQKSDFANDTEVAEEFQRLVQLAPQRFKDPDGDGDRFHVVVDGISPPAPPVLDAITAEGLTIVATASLIAEIDNDNAARASREILAVIATALTAIVGFYFGARTQSDPGETGGEPISNVNLERLSDELSQKSAQLKRHLDANPEASNPELTDLLARANAAVDKANSLATSPDGDLTSAMKLSYEIIALISEIDGKNLN